ncbi:MAG: T9SS type A sorting domain-containing protein [Bacteroidetes bacterium]|nr:T9SS type A sorting domain-containing protein [Bacteroidota bacterium]
MRNIVMFLFILFTTCYPQGWIRQDNGITADINSVYFENALDGFIAGTSCKIYKTSDGGSSWISTVTGQSETINGLSSNSKGIWAAGNNALLLLSTDNGSSWVRQNLPSNNRLNSIAFSGNTGLIAADSGKIFRTTDGGESWDLINLPLAALRSVSINGTRAVVVGGEVSPSQTMFVAISTDSGLNWQVVYNTSSYTLTSVQMVSQSVVYAVGIRGTVLKSTDGGNTWSGLPTYTTQWLYGLHFLDANNGYICGGNVNSGLILKTTDGGTSFENDIPSGSKWLYSIYMLKETEGFCVGASGGKLYRKTTSESTWGQLDTKTPSTLNDVSFYNGYIGLSVGDTGVVVTTSNGGDSWNFASVPTYNDLNSVDRYDTAVVVVGDSGLVLRSFGNGAIWMKANSPVGPDLLAVDLVSSGVGYAGGRNGSLIKTLDGGLSWQTLVSPTTMPIRGISFVDESVGYIAGGDFVGGPEGTGFLYRTTDGGQSWQSMLSNIPIINAVNTVGNLKIFVVGLKGFAASSPNGGLSWNLMNLNTQHWLYAIDFLNESIGYVSGGNVNTGMVWMTIDGGVSWLEYSLASAQWLYGIDVIPTKVYTCGFKGKMLRATVGLVPVELTSFVADVSDQNEIVLSWITQTETNNLGFNIERDKGAGWEKIGFISGNGTSTSPHVYQFSDRGIRSADVTRLKYRLVQMDYDGQMKYSDVIEVNLPGTESFSLLQNYPNPFNPETSINFSIPVRSHVKMTLYDILGTKIAEIADREYGPGLHSLQFNATDLPSGIYFYEMKAGNFREVKRMNLLK